MSAESAIKPAGARRALLVVETQAVAEALQRAIGTEQVKVSWFFGWLIAERFSKVFCRYPSSGFMEEHHVDAEKVHTWVRSTLMTYVAHGGDFQWM